MSRFTTMVLLVLILIAAIGYHRGWFHAGSSDVDGQRAVTVSVDKDKFDQDKATVKQDVQDLGHK